LKISLWWFIWVQRQIGPYEIKILLETAHNIWTSISEDYLNNLAVAHLPWYLAGDRGVVTRRYSQNNFLALLCLLIVYGRLCLRKTCNKDTTNKGIRETAFSNLKICVYLAQNNSFCQKRCGNEMEIWLQHKIKCTKWNNLSGWNQIYYWLFIMFPLKLISRQILAKTAVPHKVLAYLQIRECRFSDPFIGLISETSFP